MSETKKHLKQLYCCLQCQLYLIVLAVYRR